MRKPGPPKLRLEPDCAEGSWFRTELLPHDEEEADVGRLTAEDGLEDEGPEKEGVVLKRSSRFCSANEGDLCLKPLCGRLNEDEGERA
jgi:hypothetical protein